MQIFPANAVNVGLPGQGRANKCSNVQMSKLINIIFHISKSSFPKCKVYLSMNWVSASVPVDIILGSVLDMYLIAKGICSNWKICICLNYKVCMPMNWSSVLVLIVADTWSQPICSPRSFSSSSNSGLLLLRSWRFGKILRTESYEVR